MNTFIVLTLASLRMYMRQREVIIWAFLFPVLLVSVFGVVRFDGTTRLILGVVNEAGGKGEELLAEVRTVPVFDVREGAADAERAALLNGDRDMVLFLEKDTLSGGMPAFRLLADPEAKSGETELGTVVLQGVLDAAALRGAGALPRSVIRVEPVATRNLSYVDFLVPGVLSMTIMQLGIFGVAFGFVSLKRRGVLRRLRVTPLRPGVFIAAQVASRVVVLFAQMAVMLVYGILVLNLHVLGNPLLLALFGLLGAAVFLSLGFAIAGIARTEDQVPPLANLVSLPMIILSGVFFSREALPGVVRTLTEVLPLTYLADGMRNVIVNGAGATQVVPELAGLAVWTVLSVLLAARFFRWE